MSRSQLQTAIMHSFRASACDDAHTAALVDLTDRVTRIGAQAVNKPTVNLFGSYVSGFCKPTSDADYSLTYRNFDAWLIGMHHVDVQNAKRLARFARVATAEGMRQCKFIQAKIPVVQFIDNEHDIPCDVSIGNIGGVENSQILGRIRALHPKLIGCYVHCVKEWAKAREVIAPDKQTFNSFTVTIMALMVLQELGVIPVLASCTGVCGELTVHDAETQLQAWTVPAVYATLETDEHIGEAVVFLLQKFAEYYHKFRFQDAVVSLTCPRRRRAAYQRQVASYLQTHSDLKRAQWMKHAVEHTKEVGPFSNDEFSEAMKNEESQRPHASPFVVEDMVNFINCGRRVPYAKASHIHKEFTRLFELLHSPRDVSFADIVKPSHVLQRSAFFEGASVIGRREMTFTTP